MKAPIIVPSQKDYKNMERYLHRKLAHIGEGGASTSFTPFKEDWPTDTTLDAFCAAVMTDEDAKVGMAYYGSLSCSGLPTGMLIGDVIVEILGSDDNKVVHLEMSSTNLAPYNWEGSYWQGTFYGWNSWENIENKVTTIASDSTDTDYPSAKAVYDAVHPEVNTSTTDHIVEPNVLRKLGKLTGTVTISEGTIENEDIENEFKFTFETGTTAPTITWDFDIASWVGNCLDNSMPDIKVSKHYEVSVVDGYACIVEFDVQP